MGKRTKRCGGGEGGVREMRKRRKVEDGDGGRRRGGRQMREKEGGERRREGQGKERIRRLGKEAEIKRIEEGGGKWGEGGRRRKMVVGDGEGSNKGWWRQAAEGG